jgi:hypothetical protein
MTIQQALSIIVKKINLDFINFNIIHKNIDNLIKIHSLLKFIWDNLNSIIYILVNLNIGSKEYKEILNKLKNSMFSNYNKFNQSINKNPKYIKKISYSNIHFYYIYDSEEQYEKDKEYIIYLFKITLCLRLYKIQNDKIQRLIIWYPINIGRDFDYEEVNDDNLTKSTNNFEAFTASGVTYGDNPRITIVTRYEEAMKLLIHELIHNYYIDGSCYHYELNDIITNYRNIKNKNPDKQNYDYEYSIYESYTELLSSYFTLLFINIDLSGNILKRKLFLQIIIEILYSYNTIANLAKLNKYPDWNSFIENVFFKGDICIYEYYYLKGLMYNNFELKIGNSSNSFKKIYQKIINMINNFTKKNDLLLKNIYEINIYQTNFKYMAH